MAETAERSLIVADLVRTSDANHSPKQLDCVACGARTVSTVGKQVDGKWYCYNCAPARTAVVTDRTPIPNPSNANTVDARYFRQLLGDYVACLNALNEFATSHKVDPLTQGELASVKDAARDRLFMWGRPTPSETSEARPRSEWHDDMGDVLWWHFPIEEAPYAGSPLDSHWEEHELDGHFTHWTPIPIPSGPVQKAFDRCAHGNVANECPHPHTDIR